MLQTDGRPRFEIAYDQLSFLLDNQFTVGHIIEMLAMFERTVYPGMNELLLPLLPNIALFLTRSLMD